MSSAVSPPAARTLRCYSFHSVKGRVGKSTLSSILALALAEDTETTLVDMDLTGTSLADVLPLCAPRWRENANWHAAPDAGFHDRAHSRRAMSVRADASPADLVEPPFLNDFLLYQTADWQARDDVHPHALGWRWGER